MLQLIKKHQVSWYHSHIIPLLYIFVHADKLEINQSVPYLEFSVNSASLLDTECYDISIDFDVADICTPFNCSDITLVSQLEKRNASNRVRIEREEISILVTMPEDCECREESSSDSGSSINSGIIAIIVLSILVVFAILAVVAMLIFYWRRTKQLGKYNIEK